MKIHEFTTRGESGEVYQEFILSFRSREEAQKMLDAAADVERLEREVEAGRAERAEHARVVRERDDARRQAADDREALMAEIDSARRAALEEAVGIADHTAGGLGPNGRCGARCVAAAIRAAAKEER